MRLFAFELGRTLGPRTPAATPVNDEFNNKMKKSSPAKFYGRP